MPATTETKYYKFTTSAGTPVLFKGKAAIYDGVAADLGLTTVGTNAPAESNPVGGSTMVRNGWAAKMRLRLSTVPRKTVSVYCPSENMDKAIGKVIGSAVGGATVLSASFPRRTRVN